MNRGREFAGSLFQLPKQVTGGDRKRFPADFYGVGATTGAMSAFETLPASIRTET